MPITPLPTFTANGRHERPTTEKINEIITALNLLEGGGGGGGGGGGATFPMLAGVWYDNGTVAPVSVTGNTPVVLAADQVAGSLIQIFCSGRSVSMIRVHVAQPPANITMLRAALYEAGTTTLIGDKVGDLGSVEIAAMSEDPIVITGDVELAPGYYWVILSSDQPIDLATIGATEYSMFPLPAWDDDEIEGPTGILAASVGAHTALPSSLASVVAADMVVNAPYILFQITHD